MVSNSLKRAVNFSFLLVLFVCGCSSPSEPAFQHSGPTMGTSFSIKVSQPLPESVQAESLRIQIDRILKQVNATMSTYLEDSELSRLNRNPSTDWIASSGSLFTVMQEALRISRLSQGAFDVTVGPLVNLWGFGPDIKLADQRPPDNQIEAHLQRIGFKQLNVRSASPAIQKQRADLYVDLSALAKGYGVDQLADYLESVGIQNYLVEVGGELRVQGRNPAGEFWRIGIEKPDPSRRVVQEILELRNTAIATSGDYRNFFEIDKQRFSHTIDPRTGYPVKHALASVTILGKSAMTADAWATAMMVLGPEAGYQLAQQEQLAAFFVVKSSTSGFTTRETEAFTAYRQQP